MSERRTFGVLIALIIIFSHSVMAADSSQFPSTPTAPTIEQCRMLMQERYEQWVKPAQDQYGRCLKQGTRFGTVVGGGRCRPSGIQAWMQCVDLQEQACLIDEKSAQEDELCRRRALAVEQGVATEKGMALRNEKRLANLIKKGERLTNLYSTNANLIMDPKAFLQKALAKSGQQALLRKMFPADFGGNGVFREDLAQQAYESAQGLARKGSNDPLISEIQASALDAIQREYNRIFAQLDFASLQMTEFTAEVASTNLTQPTRQHSPSSDATGCAVLDDFESASRLRDSNESEFLALTNKCTK
jgi:hypothetical protein